LRFPEILLWALHPLHQHCNFIFLSSSYFSHKGSLFGILTDFIHLQYFSDKILVLVVFSTWLWLNVKNMKISIYEYMNMVKTMMSLRTLEHEHLKLCVKFGVPSYGQFYQNRWECSLIGNLVLLIISISSYDHCFIINNILREFTLYATLY
jgi:hypothetical protein